MRLTMRAASRSLVLFGLALMTVLAPFGPDREPRALAALLVLFGAGLDVLERLRRDAGAPWLAGPAPLAWLIFLLGALLATPPHAAALERVLVWSAVLSGGACLAGEGSRAALRPLLGLALLLSLQALAERLYLFDQLREAARALPGVVIDEELRPFFASRRARATFGQANGLAAFLVLLLPFAARRALRSGPGRGASLVLLGVLLGALAASGSRGGALAAATAIGLALAGEKGTTRLIGRILLGASLAGWAAVLGIYLLGEALVAREGSFATLLLRRDYAATAARLGTAELPFGLGLELLGEAQQAGASFSRFAHQAVLGLYAELGLLVLPALLGLGLLLRSLAADLRRPAAPAPAADSSRPPLPLLAALALGVAGGQIGFLTGRTALDLLLVLALALLGDRLLLRPILSSGEGGDRRALAAGLLGLLLHAQIDFDLRISSLLAGAALAAAALGSKDAAARAARWRSAAFMLLVLAVASWWLLHRPIDLRRIEMEIQSGRTERAAAAREELERAPAGLLRLPGPRRLLEPGGAPR